MPSRRNFLKKSGVIAGSLLLSPDIFFPSQPLKNPYPGLHPISINGIVKAGNRGVANVVVSDGLSATKTAGDGSFNLISTSQQQFVFISIPADYSIPINPTSTANFYKPIITGSTGKMFTEFNLIKSDAGTDNHNFVVLADIHAHDLPNFHTETVPDVIGQIKKLPDVPLFGVACGDMMSDHLEHFPNYEKGIKSIGVPFFQVVGNHDLDVAAKTDEQSTETFTKHFGPAYYSFNRGKIHYVVLDDVFWFGGYVGYIDQKQLNWLKEDLSYIEPGTTVVVFAHIPLYCNMHVRAGEKKPSNIFNVSNRSLLYELLEPFNSFIVNGHSHENEFLKDGGCEIHISGAVCGAWWTDQICYDGTPKGYLVYCAEGESLSWQYKSIGENLDHQMRVYMAKNIEGNYEIIANVWTADDQWKIFWYEDGIRKGEMRKRIGTDPLSVQLYEGSKLPEGKTWIEPVPTDHLFYAAPTGNSKKIVVEAIDRWNRVYKQELII